MAKAGVKSTSSICNRGSKQGQQYQQATVKVGSDCGNPSEPKERAEARQKMTLRAESNDARENHHDEAEKPNPNLKILATSELGETWPKEGTKGPWVVGGKLQAKQYRQRLHPPFGSWRRRKTPETWALLSNKVKHGKGQDSPAAKTMTMNRGRLENVRESQAAVAKESHNREYESNSATRRCNRVNALRAALGCNLNATGLVADRGRTGQAEMKTANDKKQKCGKTQGKKRKHPEKRTGDPQTQKRRKEKDEEREKSTEPAQRRVKHRVTQMNKVAA